MVKPKTGLARQGLEFYVKGLSHYVVLCISIQLTEQVQYILLYEKCKVGKTWECGIDNG